MHRSAPPHADKNVCEKRIASVYGGWGGGGGGGGGSEMGK